MNAILTESQAGAGWDGLVVTSGGHVTLDGATVEQASGPGVHVSGQGASATITGGTILQFNDGAGVRADAGGHATIDSDLVTMQFNGEGIVASGTGSNVLVTGGDILSNAGPAFRGTLGGRVNILRDPGYLGGSTSLTLNPPVEAIGNVGGLYADGGSGKLPGGTVSAGDYVCVQEPCPSIGHHTFTNNNDGPAFDALAGEAAFVLAPENWWGTTVKGDVQTSASGSGYVQIDPILQGPPSFAPGGTAASRSAAGPASGTVVSDTVNPPEAGRGDRLWDLLTDAETHAQAGQGAAAAARIVRAYRQAESDDERLAVAEAAGRTLALVQPDELLTWAGAAASLPGPDRPWARRALAIARMAQARYAEASVVARALADEDGAGPSPRAAWHRARGLALAVEIAVAAGDGPGARAALQDLAEVDAEGAAELALSVAVAFPDVPVTFAPRPAMSSVAGKASDVTESSTRLLTVAPNPASGAVQITLAVEAGTDAIVAVFDALGREVAVLHDGRAEGSLALSLDGAALPAGLYVVRAVVRDAVGGTSVHARTVSIVR